MFVLYKAQFQEKEVDKSNNLVYSLLIVLNKEQGNFIENLGWLIYWEGARCHLRKMFYKINRCEVIFKKNRRLEN